jgi:hypothetical protein
MPIPALACRLRIAAPDHSLRTHTSDGGSRVGHRVRESVAGGDEPADTAVGQEDKGKRLLELLDKARAGTEEFDELIAEFHLAALEHIAFEEGRVWPKLRAALHAEARDDLGAKIQEEKRSAPTRPHPNAPSSPGALKTAGAVAAVTDKIRDKLAGRGN